jgi:hypothetical protein
MGAAYRPFRQIRERHQARHRHDGKISTLVAICLFGKCVDQLGTGPWL